MNAILMLIRAIVHGSFVMNTVVPDFTSHFHHTCTMSPYAEIRVVAHGSPAMNSEVQILSNQSIKSNKFIQHKT